MIPLRPQAAGGCPEASSGPAGVYAGRAASLYRGRAAPKRAAPIFKKHESPYFPVI